jgi:hypothetical protein
MESDHLSVIEWLLEGDVSIQYQTYRDIVCAPSEKTNELQNRIALEGWGKCFIDKRDDQTRLWGNGIYSPKWISTHYTLLDLKNLGISPSCEKFTESIEVLLDGIWVYNRQLTKQRKNDICICAMVLGICSYGNLQSPKLYEIVDYILDKQYTDGGWNCNWDKGDLHSSLHTTLSVLEAFHDYEVSGYNYRLEDISNRIPKAWEFILRKELFRSVHSGEIIDRKMLMLSYPSRWKYDILRCMDYFASVQKSYDKRMEKALELIIQKKRKNNRWPVQQKYAGLVHFDMEQTGEDSRFNTLRVLRVLKVYKPELFRELIVPSCVI